MNGVYEECVVYGVYFFHMRQFIGYYGRRKLE